MGGCGSTQRDIGDDISVEKITNRPSNGGGSVKRITDQGQSKGVIGSTDRGRKVSITEGDTVRSLERTLMEIEKELSNKKLEGSRRDYLWSEIPRLKSRIAERKKLEGIIVSPQKGIVREAAIPKNYFPLPEAALNEYEALSRNLRDARSAALEGGVFGVEDRSKLETRLDVVEGMASAKLQLQTAIERTDGVTFKMGHAQLGVYSNWLKGALASAESKAYVLEMKEASEVDKNVDRKKMLKMLEKHVAALPEHQV